MNLDEAIIKTVRKAMGLLEDDTSFDTDLLIHSNLALVKLIQNGVTKYPMITVDSTWNDLKGITSNDSFSMIPSYITLQVKVLFDPPPPSSAQYMSEQLEELLWRLRLAYEMGGD